MGEARENLTLYNLAQPTEMTNIIYEGGVSLKDLGQNSLTDYRNYTEIIPIKPRASRVHAVLFCLSLGQRQLVTFFANL